MRLWGAFLFSICHYAFDTSVQYRSLELDMEWPNSPLPTYLSSQIRFIIARSLNYSSCNVDLYHIPLGVQTWTTYLIGIWTHSKNESIQYQLRWTYQRNKWISWWWAEEIVLAPSLIWWSVIKKLHGITGLLLLYCVVPRFWIRNF